MIPVTLRATGFTCRGPWVSSASHYVSGGGPPYVTSLIWPHESVERVYWQRALSSPSLHAASQSSRSSPFFMPTIKNVGRSGAGASFPRNSCNIHVANPPVCNRGSYEARTRTFFFFCFKLAESVTLFYLLLLPASENSSDGIAIHNHRRPAPSKKRKNPDAMNPRYYRGVQCDR